MNLEETWSFLGVFHGAVVGLRTNQTGCANENLQELLAQTQDVIALLPADKHGIAAPVFRRMLAAKERNDNITLADEVEYALPTILQHAGFNVSLLNTELISRLLTIDGLWQREKNVQQIFQATECLKRDHPEARGVVDFPAYLLYQGDELEYAQRTLDLDHRDKEVSPESLCIRALILAAQGLYQESVTSMTAAYDASHSLRGRFLELAQLALRSNEIPAAIIFAESEISYGRASPIELMSVAPIYARNGDFGKARALIEEGYLFDNTLRDGYSRLAEISCDNNDWSGAYKLLALDDSLDRITPRARQRLADTCAHLQRWDEAETQIARAYEEDRRIKDCHSTLGWTGYLCGKGEDYFQRGLKQDENLGRLSIKGVLFHALNAALRREMQVARQLVLDAYEGNSTLRNWLSSVGWLQVRLGYPDQGRKLLELDKAMNRMDERWQASYAVAIALSGDYRGALVALADAAPALNTDRLVIGYPRYHETMTTRTRLEELFTTRLGPDGLHKIRSS